MHPLLNVTATTGRPILDFSPSSDFRRGVLFATLPSLVFWLGLLVLLTHA